MLITNVGTLVLQEGRDSGIIGMPLFSIIRSGLVGWLIRSYIKEWEVPFEEGETGVLDQGASDFVVGVNRDNTSGANPWKFCDVHNSLKRSLVR
jgi:hypothetical protein